MGEDCCVVDRRITETIAFFRNYWRAIFYVFIITIKVIKNIMIIASGVCYDFYGAGPE